MTMETFVFKLIVCIAITVIIALIYDELHCNSIFGMLSALVFGVYAVYYQKPEILIAGLLCLLISVIYVVYSYIVTRDQLVMTEIKKALDDGLFEIVDNVDGESKQE